MMERQVDHMVRLVDDLLEVSRITRGKIELRREPLDLRSVVRSGDRDQPAADRGRHGIELTVDIADGAAVAVDGDAVRLAQVFANLLNNAAKYTDAGGHIALTVAARRRARAIVSVRDNGIGIAPAHARARVRAVHAGRPLESPRRRAAWASG